jgi:hypothetical protein
MNRKQIKTGLNPVKTLKGATTSLNGTWKKLMVNFLLTLKLVLIVFNSKKDFQITIQIFIQYKKISL